MRGARVWIAAGALVAGAALAAALVALLGGRGAAVAPPRHGLAISTSVSPEVAAFGQTVTARLAVVLDRREIDPRSLERRGSFAPWAPAGEAAVTRTDVGPVTTLAYELRLRCLQRACLPPRRGRLDVRLPDLRLDFRRRGGGAGSRTLSWPAFAVVSRLGESEVARLDPGTQAPFRADLALPPPSFRVPPGLLVALLAVGAGVLIAAAGGFVLWAFVPGRLHVALRRRRRPRGTPLERALLLVERSHAREPPERRKALDRLAAELARCEEPELEAAARTLAWSAPVPTPSDSGELARSVRERLAKEVNGRGRGSR